MAIPLDETCCVSIPRSVLGEIAALTRSQSEHVQTELTKLTAADHSPTHFVYKQYGDLKVFRCGGEMRLFGVILENIDIDGIGFDHLVLLLEVSEHDYDQAGVSRGQARKLQGKFGSLDSAEEFWEMLDGAVFDEDEIASIFDSD
ncbi:hypothetical protein [Halobaculum limi]|uniref:hypothetical protein n=1 Tax=Halobaculum limi TaxID=3031916 RepID=UPI002404D576|nr:hypothetical protein [Halobaculum sp. YSMS11]